MAGRINAEAYRHLRATQFNGAPMFVPTGRSFRFGQERTPAVLQIGQIPNSRRFFARENKGTSGGSREKKPSSHRLPEAGEFVKRMQSVYDAPEMVSKYEKLAETQKEQEKYASGLVMMLQMFILDNVLPEKQFDVDAQYLDRWIDALAGDNPSFAAEAKEFNKNFGAQANRNS